MLWVAGSFGPAHRASAQEPLPHLRPAERARLASAGVPDATRYELDLELAPDLRTFTLDERVEVDNPGSAPLRSVVLRVFANATSSRPLVTLAETRSPGCRLSQPTASAIVAELDAPLAPGERRTIALRLRGQLRALRPDETSMTGASLGSLGGLFSGHGGDYGLLSESEGVASMSGFFAVLARRRAGRFEQSDASTMGDLVTDALGHYRARVVVPDGVEVVATGEEGPVRVRGARTERTIEGALLRDFALVASRRLHHVDRDVGGVAVRSWYVDGDEAAGREALEAAARAFALFERRFGPYPYTQLDVVEAPIVGGAGGVEFSGMVTVATMFYRPMDLGPLGALLGGGAGGGVDLEARRGAMLEMVTAHEVAHQWWHGLVGSDSRRHPWQDEALAQYSGILYFEDRYGAARARSEADQQVAAGYHMMRLMGQPDGPADRPVADFGDALRYAGLVYGKAPYLYPALREAVGDRRFFGALAGYVRDHRFAIAPPRALLDRMARGPRRARVRALERRWLDEAHGDEDLGEPDLGRMIGGGAGSDPQLQGLLRGLGGALGGSGDQGDLLRGLLRTLGGGGGQGGVGQGGVGRGAGQGGPGGPSGDDAVRGLLELLEGGAPARGLP